MTDDLQPIIFAAAGEPVGVFQNAQRFSIPVEETVDRLKRAIEAEDMWVLHEINPQMLLNRGGFRTAPARQILYFHPRYMARLVGSDRAAMLEAPLKFALLSLGDEECELRWLPAKAALSRYEHQQLHELGKELSQMQDRIAAAVAARG